MMAAALECSWCRRPFAARRPNAKYCSDTCRTKASRERRENPAPATRTPTRGRSTALTRGINKAVKAATWLTPQDGAAVALARLYARTIDADPDQAGILGPHLLKVLDQLGLTTLARAKSPHLAKTAAAGTQSSKALALDELRARRERQRGGVNDGPTPS